MRTVRQWHSTVMARKSAGAAALAAILVSPAFASAQRLAIDDFAAGGGTCLGHRVTDVVQPGEHWVGTAERDVVVVLGAGADVWTNAGDDVVCVAGPESRDPRHGYGSTIVTSDGNDTVITYGGDNLIQAGEGDDLVYLNGGHEEVEGGPGHDHIWALGAWLAYVHGEDGNDLIVGSPGSDFLDGGDGVDVILGAAGNDTIAGGEDPDSLFGGAGADNIDGGPDQDTCFDTLPGGATFSSCELTPPDPGLPEAGGEVAALLHRQHHRNHTVAEDPRSQALA